MSKSRADIEWENRRLCSDGNCIGVIGSDGRCKECGKPYEGELPKEISNLKADFDEEPVAKEDDDVSMQSGNNEEEKSPADIEWENRRLCSDGSCIGVIGPDGRCKECGKPFESE
ncbi:MAG: hypothetical protein SWH54_06575 [Thermodesulfobacteriota bacterium]|nr:hypothetical protein [Thermodesulfobacteriota bacterium]